MKKQDRLALEDALVGQVRALVDSAILKIMNVPMTRDEAVALVGRVRARVLDLFPDKAPVFDLVYLPRFKRVIESFVGGG